MDNEKELIYLLDGRDARLCSVKVYELEKETEATLTLKCRSGTIQVRKRGRGFSSPPRWYRTRDEVIAAWRSMLYKQMSETETRLLALRNAQEPSFQYIPSL